MQVMNFFLYVKYYNKKFDLKIFKLGQEDGEGLEKICYAPVKNDFSGPTTLSHCTVQSVWGYFKNSKKEFEDSDYLQKLYDCLEYANFQPS